MKKLTLLTAAIAMAGSAAFGQAAKRTSANNYMQYGELDNAKAAIDEASVHEKTAPEAKTWVYRGKIYQAILESKDPKYKGLSDNPLAEAYNSLIKAKQLDGKGEFADEINRILNVQATNFYNEGIFELQKSNFSGATKSFSIARDLSKESFVTSMDDTLKMLTNYYLAWGYDAEKNYEKAEEAYFIAAEMAKHLKQEKEQNGSFSRLVNLYIKAEKYDKALEVIQKGRTSLNNEFALVIDEANIYLATNQPEKALEPLRKAVAHEPDNYSAWFALGSKLEEMARKIDDKGVDAEAMTLFKEAEEKYESAIKQVDIKIKEISTKVDTIGLRRLMDEKFTYVYSIGALHFNRAVQLNNFANSIDDQKKFDVARKAADTVFEHSQPILERAFAINGSDRQLLISLKQLYYRKITTPEYEIKYNEVVERLKTAK